LQGSPVRTNPHREPLEAAREAGRGGLSVLGAKIFFLVAGFIQQPLLRLAVGLNDFGALAQALVVANTVNNVVVATGTQGVSLVVAGRPGQEQLALRAVMRVHAPLAVAVSLAVMACAPLYARFEHAPDVALPLVVLALVALLYGVYAPLVGYLNGQRRFGRQAALDVTFAALRTVGLVAFGRAFSMHGLSGVLGVTVGWVAAAACIVPLAFGAIGQAPPLADRATSLPSGSGYLAMLLPIAGVQLCTNALLQVDIGLLGRFLSQTADVSQPAAVAREIVKSWVAIYKECQTFAFLPYQLLFSITLVLFPMLARAHAESDREAVRVYVLRGARLAAIFAGLLVSVIVAMPESLLAFAYGKVDAARGADVLRIMAIGQGAFAMLGIEATVLTSLGRQRVAAMLTLAALAAVAIACAIWVPNAPFGHDQLLRSAQASAGALIAMLLVGAAIVHAWTGAFVPLATSVRVTVALAAWYALGFVMPTFSRVLAPGIALAVALAYMTILVVSGELGGEDLRMLRALISRRPGPS
jgi:stage V sporulation protein B